MSRLQRSIVIVWLFTLCACSQNPGVPIVADVTPTFTPWVGGTQTALAVASQAALTPLPSPTFTPPVVEKPTDFSPVIYGGKLFDTPYFLLLGGVSKNAWLKPDESFARFAGEVTYSASNLTQESKYFVLGRAPKFEMTCEAYVIGTDAGLDEAGLVAVVDGWDITKRDVAELSADGSFYQQAVIDWLAAEGVDDPQLGTVQVFRVDIEGDGTDEIFISATHLDASQHTTKAGDYSIILMRKVSGNDAVTQFVVGDLYDSQDLEITYPRTYSLTNFIDLNQDGVLEVVVDFRQWEGFGAIVFQIDEQNVIQSLRAEC